MMKEGPLVSVICLCYNHGKYVVEAMQSVLDQNYRNVELIVVDDASEDGSQEIIRQFCNENPKVQYELLSENHGNCSAFNIGWKKSKGKYIIDLAADDLLLPNRITLGVQKLEESGEEYGVHYCDVRKIDQNGNTLSDHITSNYISPVPEGYIFKQLLERYFINPVSMMLSNGMLKELDGFDESLSYEDFDLWVRSSKYFKYCYSPEVAVVKRILRSGHSSSQYSFGSTMLRSTYKVCEKAYHICESRAEFIALRTRIRFELRKSIQSLNLQVGILFYQLKQKVNSRIKELS